MTHRERDLLRWIERFVVEHDGVAPTLLEMAQGIGCASKSSAHRLLAGLRRRGIIDCEAGYSRTVRITQPTIDLSGVDDATILSEAARRGLVWAAA